MMIRTEQLGELIQGAEEIEPTAKGLRPHRLPAWVRAQFPDPQLLLVEAQPSGVRLAMNTEARAIELKIHSTRVGYLGMERARGAVDVLVDGGFHDRGILEAGDLIEVDLENGSSGFRPGASQLIRFEPLPEGRKQVEIWLPHNESVELIELLADAPLARTADHRPVWLHHGSSISHGSNAAGPSEIWPAIAAHAGGVALHNLGFGGSALLDPFMARVMRDRPADLISLKLGINVVNLDGMRLRTFGPAVHGFLDTVRDGHPETPLLLISSVLCPIHEDTPGPGAFDPRSLGTGTVSFIATGDPAEVAYGKLNLKVIRRELAAIVEQRADPNLHYLDGTVLYGEADSAAHPLPDALHPDTRTHRIIGERFADFAFGPGGPFKA